MDGIYLSPDLQKSERPYEEDVKLAGLRINPLTNISSTITYIDNLKIKNLKGKSEVQVKGLPQNAHLAYFSFSQTRSLWHLQIQPLKELNFGYWIWQQQQLKNYF